MAGEAAKGHEEDGVNVARMSEAKSGTGQSACEIAPDIADAHPGYACLLDRYVAIHPSTCVQGDEPVPLESVREHQAGLQSFRSMRRIEARRKNASALRLRFSQSLASLRQRLSQAMVRSTTQRRGSTTNPLA